MTVNQTQDTRSVVPAQSNGPDAPTRPARQDKTAGWYRSARDDDAYRRSEMEQAQIDIAAGW